MEAVTVAVIAAASSAVVAPCVNFALQKLNNKGAIAQGMRALLWRELKTIHRDVAARSEISVDEREHLESVYQAYHVIGGNGTGTRLYNEAMDFPTTKEM